MTLYQFKCDHCDTYEDQWMDFEVAKKGYFCAHCGEGTMTKQICAAFVPQVPGEGVWRTEVRSKEVGRVAAPRWRGEDIRVVDDGSKRP